MSQVSKRSELDQDEEIVLLPLFPLRLVLFPGQVLPLHIFEPRYRLMVNQCIQERQPFGVVLMRDDTADWREYKQDVALPYEVGTTAHIRQVERLSDGRLNIVTMGLHRFRVRRLRFDQPYLQAEVSAFPLDDASAKSNPHDLRALRRLLVDYVDLLSKVMDAEIDVDEIPSDPRTLAFLAASALQISWEDKQALLAAPALPSLLTSELDLLRREKVMLNFMWATEGRVNDQVLGPTGYLYPN